MNFRLKPSDFTPATVAMPFCIDIADGVIETTATVDAETGEVISVTLGGAQITPYLAAEIVGEVEFDRQLAMIRRDLPEVVAVAARGAFDAQEAA
jgi:hypothetical protein